MPIKHVDKLIEAYLDGRLSPDKQHQVKSHVRDCPECARRLFDARRLNAELGTVMTAALGKPDTRPMLYQQVRETLRAERSQRSFYPGWAAPTKVLSAAGTAALIALLAVGTYTVIRGQILSPGPETSTTAAETSQEEARLLNAESISIPEQPVENRFPVDSPQPERSTLGEKVPLPETQAGPASGRKVPLTTEERQFDWQSSTGALPEVQPKEESPADKFSAPRLPDGTIAFALFNTAEEFQTYEIHFIDPDGTDHYTFPLKGVSEPALHPLEKYNNLTFRAWSEPTSPRSLLSSDTLGQHPQSISNFWEDSQPDWSPTENRIIFASQRESDRRWRLYSAWGDGSLEINLRREGKSPTFAPDGYRFAFESCDNAGHSCGLWVGDLEHSEFQSKPILVDASSQVKAPDWSPVSERIAYMANPDGDWDLFTVNSDGSNRRRETTTSANEGLPAWSPDGEWLAYVSDQGGAWSLWLLHLKSGYKYKATAFDEALSLTPANRLPYNQHGERFWWDEQLSWGP